MICHVSIQTGNIQESIDFYQWLMGLPVISRRAIPSTEIAFLGENETKLEFVCKRDYKKQNKIDGISVGFKVDNLDEKIEMLKSRNIAVSEIRTPSPKTRFCFFTDLHGVTIQLFEEK